MMKLFLIDGNSQVFRAFYAIRGLTDSRGRPTNAIFGFTNMLLKIIREKKPDAVAVAFDTPHPTERHELYEKYKAHRPETPEELASQFGPIKDVIRAFGIEIYEEPGYEADDVLGTLAEHAAARGDEVYIVTGDKDMLQLVSDSVKMYDPMKDRVIGVDEVKERLGVPPERVVEYMALVGDPSDNIPGIKGVGDKTARALLEQFGSLEELMEHTERIQRPRTRRLVQEGIEDMKLSRRLARINREVPLRMEPEDFRLREPDWQALLSIFRDYEFSSFMKLIPGGGAPAQRHCETVTTKERLRDLLGAVGDEFVIDTMSAARNTVSGEMVGYSVATERGRAAYVPFGHTQPGAAGQLRRDEALRPLRPIAEDEAVAKAGHDLKKDIMVLGANGINMRGMLYDTMLASYLLNPLKPDHGIENVCLEHLGRRKRTLVEVAGKGGFEHVEIRSAADYACEEAEVAFELREKLFSELREQGLQGPYFEMEMPLVYVLAEMEATGMKLDTSVLRGISGELEAQLESLQGRIYFLAGCEFNINSPKQLGRVLFEQLGLAPRKRKKTGYSTDVGVLEELALEHELPGEVLAWRSLNKLKTTYVDVLPGLINPRTGRLHTSFNQAATATGRLSSSNPNLQNIPIRGDWGTRIREAFTAEDGNIIVSADYSQIELRILAHICGDAALKEAFSGGVDVHTRTASEIFGVPPKKVTSEMRRVAKTVNFGVVYGITSFGLSEALGVSRADAQQYIDNYFRVHPGVKDYIERTLAGGLERGYVETLFGRRRPVPELKSKNANKRMAGRRLAVNAPIQGTAADVIKLAMISISRRLKEEALRGRMILQVHDELVFECPEAEKDALVGLVRREMEGAAELSVPLEVEVGAGRNWAEAHS